MFERLNEYINDNKTKIEIYDNSVYIENYDKILLYRDTIIKTSNISIIGINLIINKLMDDSVLITGDIYEVKLK